MHFIYQALRKEDLPFIEKLFKYPSYDATFFELNTSLKHWQDRFEEIKTFQLIYKGKEQIGILNLDSKNGVIDITLLAFCFEKTNKGYGRLVLQDIIIAHPNKRITVDAMKSNVKAIRFYKNNGFVEVGTKIEDYEENGLHKYVLFERVQNLLYEDKYYKEFLNLNPGEENKEFVSSPENILYKHLKDKTNTKLQLFKLQNNYIGCLLLKHNKEYNNIFIWQFIVDSNYQNKGIGTIIIKNLLRELKEKYNDYGITTTILDNNHVSMKLFTKVGFIIHSYEPQQFETNYIFKMTSKGYEK